MDPQNQQNNQQLESFLQKRENANTSTFRRRFKSISSTLLLIITAPLLAIFITSHIFHSYEVDGQSMETTLQSGDRLIVYKLPKTISNISGSTYMPGRWDIIVFDRPTRIAAPSKIKQLIKRVIALPGERVRIENGEVTVFNDQYPDGFSPDKGKEYSEGFSNTINNIDVTVGNGQVFVLGDNRSNSTDSRSFGPISTDLIVGNATARFVPVGNMERF